MPFDPPQVRALSSKLNARHVRTRESQGRTLSYIEGWHAIAEANRIFGYDALDRQTVSNRCVWQGQSNGRVACAYVARVRVKVRAGETVSDLPRGLRHRPGPWADPRRGARVCPQGGGDRCHEAGADDLR